MLIEVSDAHDVIAAAKNYWKTRTPTAEALVGAIAYFLTFDAYAETSEIALTLARPPAPLAVTGGCACVSYAALPIEGVERVIQATSFAAMLNLVVTTDEGHLSLYRCPTCERTWQGSPERQHHLYAVPSINVDDWTALPFVDPLEWARYQAQVAEQDRTQRDEPCRREGCSERAVVFSVLCFDHHNEAAAGIRRPRGRLLP